MSTCLCLSASSAPRRAAIIHLGATSCYVGDNTDVIILREASRDCAAKSWCSVIEPAGEFADKYKALPCLGLHPFPARAAHDCGQTCDAVDSMSCSWILKMWSIRLSTCCGCSAAKGTTGTQASFMELFDGRSGKGQGAGSEHCQKRWALTAALPVSGQTYSRKIDAYFLISPLAAFAQSAYKFSNDMRLAAVTLRRWRSRSKSTRSALPPCPTSATPCARERIASLARYVMADTLNPAITAAHPVV